MNKHKTILLLLVVIIIATFLRLYQITTTPPGLYPDEAMNGNNVSEALHGTPPNGGFKVFYPENNGREGLFMNIQAMFFKAFGEIHEPWVLRVPSAIFGILTVLGVYFLGRLLFSSEVGLLSAFFIATNFWHINFSRIGFRAIMAPFFLTWALCFYIWAMMRRVPTRKWAGYLLFVFGGIVYGLGFYSYISYRVTPVLMLLLFYYFWRKSKKEQLVSCFYKGTLLFIVASIIAFLPLGLYFIGHPQDFFGRTSELSVFRSSSPLHDFVLNIVKTAGMFNVAGDSNWRHNLSGSPELFWPVGLLFLLGTALGIRALFKNRMDEVGEGSSGQSFALIFLWGLLAALPVVISNEGLPHALRAILMIPPVIILAGYGGMTLYRWAAERMNRRILIPCTLVILLFFAFNAYYAYFATWAKNPNTPGAFASDYVTLGRTINALPISTPKYIVVDAGGVLVRGIPMPAETVMFITDTFLPDRQAAKNVHYILPDAENTIPQGSKIFHIQ